MLGQIIRENINEEAQEIKRRLSIKGQDVDETVICELLESLDPNHEANRIDYIINMIADNWDFDFQKSSNEAGPSIKIEHQSQMQNDTKKFAKLVQNSSTESAETIDVSDSEDDRDYYYNSSNCDDTTAANDLSCFVIDTTLDQTIGSNGSIKQTCINVGQSTAEVEFLEEKNNNEVIYMNTYEKNRVSESPKPGCSKDSDDRSQSLEEYCHSCDIDELQIDAKQIHTLLPNFDYPVIYKKLCNNQLAKNRIELTLWDLLPKERPNPQLASKRKFVPYETCSIRYKKNSNVSPEKNVADTKTILEKEKQVCECVKNEIKTVEPMSLINETKMKRDVTVMLEDDATAMNSTDNDTNNQQIDLASEAKLNCVDTSTYIDDIDMCEDTHDSEKSELSVNDSKTKELQSTMNSAMPQQTEIDNICSTTIPTAMLNYITLPNPVPSTGPSTSIPNITMPSIVGPIVKSSTVSSIADSSTTVSNITGPSTSISSTIIPSIVGPIVGSSTIVSSIVGPSIVISNIAGPSTSVSSTAMPSIAEPIVGPSTAVHSIAGPSTAVSKSPRNAVLRPARFTILKAGASSAISSSKQWGPILKPSKFNLTDTIERLMNAGDTTIHTTNDMEVQVDMNKEKMRERSFRFKSELECFRSYSSVKPVKNSITVPPNKTPSSAKKLIKLGDIIAEEQSSAKLMKLVKSNLLLQKQSNEMLKAISINTCNQIISNLKKECGDEENNLRQQDDMKAICEEEKEKQKFMLAFGMEANTNKEKQRSTVNNANQEIILNEKARKMYYKLIPMFPSVDTAYIKRLCQDYLTEDKNSYSESSLLQALVEHLLDNGQRYPILKKVEPLSMANNSNTYDLNEQYADLLGIFPEADPMYLRKVAEDIYKDPEKIREFVQSKLENPDYPTRAQYLEKKKITEQQKQYTTHFQIKQFLQLFPDPFSHFENAKRQCKFNPHAADFLKQHFSKIRVHTLLNTYSENSHNLSLTAKALETLSSDMKTKRSQNKMMLTEDIPLLQECAFIQHKAALQKYLTELKAQEEKEFQELKARNELIECQCCFDDECIPSKCSTCEDGHIFCNACIVRSTELILANGKAHVDCLLNCGNEFPLSVLQKVLPPTQFSILLCKRQEAEVMAAGLEGLVSCPFCHFASIPPPEDKVFRCLNPNCMKESCRLCKELNHIPLKCNEVKSDVARLYLEEKMTEALVRKCYKCGRTFFKEEGCNKMTCLCGAQMCYICDKPVTDYRHFQGQGVQDSTLCPLWSDDRRMNAESVIKVCQETMKHIKQKNPQIDINVNALLPKLPPKRKGPHEDIALANALPVHAERIARHNP